MGALSPTRYLRVKAEEMLARGATDRWGSPLDESARALVAARLIDPESAQRIVDDYASAAAGAGVSAAALHPMDLVEPPHGDVPAEGATVQPAASVRRTVVCVERIQRPDGVLTIQSLLLEPHLTSVGVRFQSVMNDDGSSLSPPSLELSIHDDRGRTSMGRFSGFGAGGNLRGRWLLEPPLRMDTEWIEVEGQRITLNDRATPTVEVRVEDVSKSDPVLAFLWHRLATPRQVSRPPAQLDDGINALVACGAIAAEEPLLKEVRAVASALQTGEPDSKRSQELPEPWLSLIATRSRAAVGRHAAISTYVALPRIDGTLVEITGLNSHQKGADLEVALHGGSCSMPDSRGSVGRWSLSWWARDDLGNHYLGAPGSGGGDQVSWSGEINFRPAFDPNAKIVDLIISGETERCVVELPLRWEVN